MGRPIERIETPAGDPAWHVTSHAQVRVLLADERLGRAHPDPASAGWYSKTDVAGRPTGGSESEYAEHAWWRKAMNKVFSPRNLEAMAPTIRAIADESVADVARLQAPVDLNKSYSTRLTSQVMCALLRVPTEDIGQFQQWTEDGAQATDLARSLSGITRLMSYVDRLVRQRQLEPGDDVVSVLVAAGSDAGGLHLGRVVKLLAGMLAFGRETPASVIDWGAMLLLTNPDQLELLRSDRSLARPAVEEVLRLFKPPAATEDGLLRYAHADVEVGDVTVRTGDMVLLDLMAANRDPTVFPDPDRFDVTRDPNPHMTFGYGFYMCNFTRLARVEISTALTTLFDAFPTLRLTEPPEQLGIKEHLRTGGLAALPVAW